MFMAGIMPPSWVGNVSGPASRETMRALVECLHSKYSHGYVAAEITWLT